ncbi:MAG: hypothetical protein IJI14_15935 [Anaerolineaceae bacterium]|nr:hypothetical protein [Anaerolineaceae bacterium]
MSYTKQKTVMTILYVLILIAVCFLLSVKVEKDKSKNEIIAVTATMPLINITDEPKPTLSPNKTNVPKESVKHKYSLRLIQPEDIRNRNSKTLLRSDFANNAKFYTKPNLVNCWDNVCTPGILSLNDKINSQTFYFYDSTDKLIYASIEVWFDENNARTADLDIFANAASVLPGQIFENRDYIDTVDKNIIKSLALNFFSSYIPEHLKIPAIYIYQTNGYYVTFIMDADVFAAIISFDRPLFDYVIKNSTD